MLSQTIDQLLPLLYQMQQPAFCVRQDGAVVCNQAAKPLAPMSADALSQWLGDSAEAYENWDRTGSLSLPIPLAGQTCSAAIQPLQDGTLFLLSQCESLLAGANPLSVTAQVLRQPLTDLSNLVQQLAEDMEELEDPVIQNRTARISRQVYRLSRIACNLADLERFRNGSYQPRLAKLDLLTFLTGLTTEMEDLCRMADRQLNCKLPEKSMFILADAMLLERAIFNLLSNALKYGRKDKPIQFRVDTTASAVLLRMQNVCTETDSDLLSAAFQRLEQRGALPDPQWGIGLGIPIIRYIAQLMGGTVAVEVRDDTATITMSVSRKKNLTDTQVKMPPPFDYTGGMRHSLVELSDCLPNACFDSVVL